MNDLQQKLEHYRLNEDEYAKIKELLGREPQGVEWALFSALWSEHCSYKSSKVHLKKFFSQSERVVEGFGENAGVIDLGEGERVAFKMESHNHPSFIEPYEGAATGVGGILRDIFTMGARPVAAANFLCFGEPKAERMSHLVDGVVRGIGGYGNCVGVPTVTGQTEFDPSYNGNILVNAFALGLFRPGEKVFTSRASGPGNFVVYVGAKTGRDGVHGASMASESFDDDSESKKPTVQKGDPFFEKLLIESCIEVMSEGLVVAIQDMGAAGLTSSAFEMASKGGVGFTLHLDQVPLRDSTITPEEILLSESQERMLLICEPQNFQKLQKVFQKWDLDAEKVGEVTAKKTVDLYWHNECLTSIEPAPLVDNAPMYQRPYNPWQAKNRVERVAMSLPESNQLLLDMLSDYRGCSRSWVFDQYDQRVCGMTVRDATNSIAVQRLPDSGRGLGVVLGCRPSMMRFDAREGGKDAVAYPALELAAKGFEALAVTDCLNFGNPEKPEVMSEFVAAVEGMNEVCTALRTPVISGNVSLYNETQGKNVTSTPSTGLVGLRSSIENIPKDHFQSAGEKVYLLQSTQLTHGGVTAEFLDLPLGGVGQIDTEKTRQFVKAVYEVISGSQVQASRMVGKFGLAYALARMAERGCGAELQWPPSRVLDWFIERAYELVVSVKPEHSAAFEEIWQTQADDSMNLTCLGETGGATLTVKGLLEVSCAEISEAYNTPWESHFETLA